MMKHTFEKIEKTINLLNELKTVQDIPCTGFHYKTAGYKKDNQIPVMDDTWQELTEYLPVSGEDMHIWMIGNISIPKIKADQFAVLEFSDNNPNSSIQTCVYVDGQFMQEFDRNHLWARLEAGRDYRIALYHYYGQLKPYREISLKVKIISEKTERLYYDMEVPFEVMSVLDKEGEACKRIGKKLELACNRIDFRNPYSEAFYSSIEKAARFLQEEFYEKECGNNSVTVHCIGHSHIDVAWYWTTRQTREKIQRTVSMVLKLMEEYPEYRFMLTQPQLFMYLKEEAPELYEKVKQRVAEGRFEIEGAMWLEADGNLPSGESFIRQILAGKKFIREEFGKESRLFWIPDVFGYSAALPQILRKCGVDRFVTGKISWNDTNRMPNDTFYWQGIDGTRIFTQFLTTKDFGNPDKSRDYVQIAGQINAEEIKSSWDIYRNKSYNKEVLTTYGHGDGGGGPTREMLERQRRFSYGLPGMPKTQLSSVNDFLDRVKENFDKSCKELQKTPEWVGELYLEYHRGTYTSMAKNKKKNRRGEFLMHNAELLAAGMMVLEKSPYPVEELEKAWKLMLLNQFHDIIPGSSAKQVYEDSDRDYEEIFSSVGNIVEEKMDVLAKNIRTAGGYLIYNPGAYQRNDVVNVEGKTVYVKDIPSMGWSVVTSFEDNNQIVVKDNSITSDNYILQWNQNGNIVSLYDRIAGRELIAEGGEANRLEAYEDKPLRFEAWEITSYYNTKKYAINTVESITEICDGERKGVRIVKKYENSTIRQDIWLYQHLRRIDFETIIDWKEKDTLVKALFPLAIKCDKVTAEIQFGNVERATHKNTGWDEAKFETCMHKWVDLSDNGYGVSILNDCKYGYSCHGSEIGISLLKSAVDPNPDADKEIHELTYSLYPHEGRYHEAETVVQAYNLNNPLLIKKIGPTKGKLPEKHSFVKTDQKNVIIETVKKCEYDDNIIVRLYECHNMRCRTKVGFGFPVKNVFVCDMEENILQKMEVKEQAVWLDVHNFEVVTLKVDI